MKLLGGIVYISGFLILAYIITETRIDLGGSFGGILTILAILGVTMGLGSALMNAGNNNGKGNDKQD